jgi:hypothetical protein
MSLLTYTELCALVDAGVIEGVQHEQINDSDVSIIKFGRWSAISESRKTDGYYKTKCQCDCGVVREVVTASLRNGASTSCGCISIERNTKHGHAKRGKMGYY